MRYVKLPSLLLACALLFSLAACKPAAEPAASPTLEAAAPPTQEPTAGPAETPSPADDGQPGVRLAVLSGPTGVGAAKLLDNIDHNPAALHESGYSYIIANDNTELVAGLTRGEIDIATVASNVAVNLYNKTDGGVKIIAVGTLGVLHILEGGGKAEINAVSDLKGRTVYAAGQGANPEYVLRYLLQANGLEMGKDVEVVFADASEISAKLLSGDIECAMLPVPAATAAMMKSEGRVRQAVDLTQAWDGLRSGSQLIMTAVVVRSEFAQSYPGLVDAFLTDYAASIEFVNNNQDAAAELIAGLGITPSAAIAQKAIPQCHLTFISGMDMVGAISSYYSVLWSIDPASVGGCLPDDGIYWVGGESVS